MEYVSNILFWISNGLLVPVIVGLLYFFIRSILMLGGFFNQYLRRTKQAGQLKKQLDTWDGAHLDALLPTIEASAERDFTEAVRRIAATAERAITIADSGHGRLGIRHALQLPKALLARHSIRADARVLVLGTGEFIHPPAVFARELATRSGADVYLQSSSRSPALPWGALPHKRSFADPYDAGVPYYLYNLATPDAYDHVFICHEHPANAALRETAATLDARLLHLRAKRDKT